MYQKRREKVIENLRKNELSQILISDPKSIWYLTGVDVEPYERLFAFYLRTDGTCRLFLNALFHISDTDIEKTWFTDSDDGVEIITHYLDREAPLGIDKEWPAKFLIPLQEKCDKMKTVLASDAVDDARACKDQTEQQLMREASEINDEVIQKGFAYIREGITEKEVAAYIDNEFLKAGCSGPSFTTIVSFGANAADPHHVPDETVLREGDCVLIDMGCVKERYCSDMTRTNFYKTANPKYTQIHDLVKSANESAESLIKPGVKLCELDNAARELITKAGYGEAFNHRLGHFIGQTDHEKGDVSGINQNVLKPGMIFSIEPGVYLEGEFGVRIEDLVLVTEDGCEVLNKVNKKWEIIQ